MEDRELVKKLLAKDEESYKYFYQEYWEKLYKLSVHILGYQDPDAEDVTQEVFMAALQQLSQFEFRSSLYHWLYCICTYRCYVRIRNRKRLVSSLEEELDAISKASSVRHQEWKEDEAEQEKIMELVENQKKLLGDPCKSLLRLRDGENMSYAQLSSNLRVPMGTVMSRLARCKETLKNLVLRALKEATHG